MLKIRTRRFNGRCSRHKRYNPAIDGRGAIKGNCARCSLLADIYEASLKLNGMIRRFNPNHDDLEKKAVPDDRQMSLLDG